MPCKPSDGSVLAQHSEASTETLHVGMHDASLDDFDDAWGLDDESTIDIQGQCKSTSSTHNALKQRLLSSRKATSSQTAGQELRGAYSLQAYCLGCLGQYIEELLEVGQEVLPLLPPDAKASLMAIARRQGLLDDSALALLIDSSWTCLDLYGSNVTDSGVQVALANTPQLLLLDVSGCKVSQHTIRKLGSWCPQLQVLRIGTKVVTDSINWAVGVKHIMPTVVQVETVMDSWEVLACEEQGLSKPVAQSYPEHNANRSPLYSRLTKLEYLTWPQIPVKTAHLLAHKYPKVAVNPKPGLCPEQADPATPVDQPLILSVAPFWQLEQSPELAKEEHIVPLSERFRMAYVSRAERIAAKAERNYQQKRRRQLRNDTVLQALARFKFL